MVEFNGRAVGDMDQWVAESAIRAFYDGTRKAGL